MIHGMYAIYDSKARAFMQPFFSLNHDTARRATATAVNDPGSMLHKFPEDFTLHALGQFEDENGAFLLTKAPENLGPVAQFKEVAYG